MTALGLAAGTGSLGCGAAQVEKPVAHTDPRRPNVVLIVTDDQTVGSVNARTTPNIYRWFVQRGRSYPGFFASDPLCAPSRAAIMTGRYSHNTGIRDNDPPPAGSGPQMRPLIQCSLQARGYSTGLYGKYYNGYDFTRNPPCLSDYAITPGDKHTGLEFRSDGRMVTPAGWQDDYISRRSLRFLRAQQPDRPFFLFESLLEPHSPYTDMPQRVARMPVPAPFASPSVWEPPRLMAQKAPVIREHALRTGYGYRRWVGEERMLMDVDRYVGDLFGSLRRHGELKNTLVVFLSDNGSLFGEHHLRQKRLPYTEAIAVPAYIYGPRWVGRGATTDGRLATTVDIAPTILQATRIRPGQGPPLDGRSLLRRSWRRADVLGESWRLRSSAWQPGWRGIRTRTFQYIEYLTDGPRPRIAFREYYDLILDPNEMDNLLADGIRTNDPDVAKLHAMTVAAATCRGTTGANACP